MLSLPSFGVDSSRLAFLLSREWFTVQSHARFGAGVCLSILARGRYDISLAADATRFDVQLRELFITILLVLGALFLILTARATPFRYRIAGAATIVAYYAIVMSTSKSDPKTNITRSLISILTLLILFVFAGIGGIVYVCYRASTLRKPVYGVPRGLWISAFVVLAAVLVFSIRVHRAKTAWPRGLFDSLRNDPSVSSCRLPSPTPYMRGLPKSALSFWAGSPHCEPKKEPRLGRIRFEAFENGHVVEFFSDPSSVSDDCLSANIVQIIEDPDFITYRGHHFVEDRSYAEYLSSGAKKAPRLLYSGDGIPVPHRHFRTTSDVLLLRCDDKLQYLANMSPRRRTSADPPPPAVRQRGSDGGSLGPADGGNSAVVPSSLSPSSVASAIRNGSKPPSLLVLTIDCLGRAYAHHSMKKTMAVLTDMSRSGKYDVTEFFRYHTVGHATSHNLPRLLRGVSVCDELGDTVKIDYGYTPCSRDFAKHPFIFARAKRAGYRTSAIIEECDDFFSEVGTFHVPRKIANEMVDHIVNEIFCDDSYDGLPRTTFNGVNGLCRRCINGNSRHALDYTMDYVTMVARAYRPTDFPVLNYAHILDGHEGTGDVLAAVDGLLAQRLQEYFAEFPDTILVMAGDHGSHMGPHYEFFDSGRLEHKLPFLAMSFPKDYLSAAERRHLNANSQKLINADDIHATLADLVERHRSPTLAATVESESESESQSFAPLVAGKSLLSVDVGDRSCADLTIRRDCQCQSF